MNIAIPSKTVVLSAVIFSFFSVAIMTYVSMATPIGPWVELIVVLASTMMFRFIYGYTASERLKNAVGLTTVAAGVAGVVGVVCGFTVPTLYFLDSQIFNIWLSQPYYFSAVIAGAIIAGGGFALGMVTLFGERMLLNTALSFPVAQMVSKMILAQNQLRKALELSAGMIISCIYFFLQRIVDLFPQILRIPDITLGQICTIPGIAIRLDLLPLFMAIGYVAGAPFMVPLLVGVISKVLIIYPLKHCYFAHISSTDFILGFGGGMVLQGVIVSFIKAPQFLLATYNNIMQSINLTRRRWRIATLAWIGAYMLFLYFYFRYFNFSLLSQAYLFLFTALCVYQLMIIGGQVGLAPFGRFATLVMMPGLLLFSYDYVQVMLVSLFVGIAGGVAVDCMFGRKLAQLNDLNKRDVFVMQLLGLIISACVFGFVFIKFVGVAQLGSLDLVAQRARARALLLSIHHLHYALLMLGGIFGFIIESMGMKALLVFTGFLFPIDFSLMLILGGSLNYVAHDKDEWDPFWSGVFVAASLWMFVRSFV